MPTETVLESNDIETVAPARVGDTLGYARVSTHDQNPDAQSDRLIEAGASLARRRAGFLRGGGSALATASRTIRRCTPSLRATPLIVPTPNSYSRRISSNSSTLLLQSNSFLRCGRFPQTEYPLIVLGGPNQGAERGQFRMPNSLLTGSGPSRGTARTTRDSRSTSARTSWTVPTSPAVSPFCCSMARN